MNRQRMFPKLLALGLTAGIVSGSAWAQAVAASDTPPVAQPAAATSDTSTAAATSDTPATDATTNTPAPAAPAAKSELSVSDASRAEKAGKKKDKGPYTGTWEVVVLPPTPLLDHEGKQRVDPDGNLMFNPAVKQIRDKKGHPVFDDKDNPVFQTATNLGYDVAGKKISPEKVKPPKMMPMSISDGMLTVDGWTGKARLNYDIPDLKYLYLYAPGIGTTIVSHNYFPGAKEVPAAFDDKSLKITVDGHPIELSSSKSLLGKKPLPAWVAVDREYTLPVKFPVIGYGTTTKFPYAWPGSKDSATKARLAPPLPQDLQPTLALAACPMGMMRPTGSGRLPGQKAVEQPCVPISSGTSASATAVTATAPLAH